MKAIIMQLMALLLSCGSILANPIDTTKATTDTFGYERHTGESLIVHAIDGLKLRLEPSFQSRVITVLDYGEVLTQLGEVPGSELFSVGYTTGKWIHVDMNGLDGYVFDGFVSSLPIPEVLPHTEYLIAVLEQYANLNFNLLSTDTIARSSEMDERFHVKYRFNFEDNIRMQHDSYWEYESVKLEFPNIRIMDAYLLVKALLIVSDLKSLYGEGLIFKVNEGGEIYEISDRYREDIIIKQHAGNSVSIEFKTYVGC